MARHKTTRYNMTIEEMLKQLKLDRDMANFNPMTGEEKPMNEECKASAEALSMAIDYIEMTQKTLKELCQLKLVNKEINELDSLKYEDVTDGSVDNKTRADWLEFNKGLEMAKRTYLEEIDRALKMIECLKYEAVTDQSIDERQRRNWEAYNRGVGVAEHNIAKALKDVRKA